MSRIYGAFIEIVASAVFIIPIFFIYERLMFHNIKRTLLYMAFAFYLVAVLALVGFPNITYIRFEVVINLFPFVDMVSDFRNALLNIALFVPLGAFLPVLSENCRQIKKTVLIGFCTTFVIEVVQIFTFRTTDINDIIVNVVGTLIGYFIAKIITKNFTKYIMQNTKNTDIYIIYGTVSLVMFFAQPFVSSILWQIVIQSRR